MRTHEGAHRTRDTFFLLCYLGRVVPLAVERLTVERNNALWASVSAKATALTAFSVDCNFIHWLISSK